MLTHLCGSCTCVFGLQCLYFACPRLTRQEQEDLMLAQAIAASEEEARQQNTRRATVRLTLA
jgi:hypothetical protein